MKTLVLMIIVTLLLGGIIGTSYNVFDNQKQSPYVSLLEVDDFQSFEKLSMRQIDSLSAASNLSFTIKNAVR